MEVRRDQWRKRPRRGDAAVCPTQNPRRFGLLVLLRRSRLGGAVTELVSRICVFWARRCRGRDQSCESHTGFSVPANSSGRVSLDRYQDLEIDLRECSITRQKRVARSRDGPVKPLSCITSGLMRGKRTGGSWRRSVAGQGATRHFENAIRSVCRTVGWSCLDSRFHTSSLPFTMYVRGEPIREVHNESTLPLTDNSPPCGMYHVPADPFIGQQP